MHIHQTMRRSTRYMQKATATMLTPIVALALLFTSCHSNTYKISGTIEGAENGDTLFLTTDMENGTPFDTLIVSDGKFSTSGEADSVRLGMIYSNSRNEQNAPFFLEAGSISIAISETPGASRVGGTLCNNRWQELNDSVMLIGKEINRIAEHIYGSNLSQDEQQKGMEQIDRLNQRFARLVVATTERNIDNEFGYFLLTYYPEELIDNATKAQLIKQLPDKMRSRAAVKEMERTLAQAAKTAEGSTISDFSQPSPDGSMLSMMSEIRQHKVTVIDFWASWCGPCRQEMPFMVEMYSRLKDRGLGIVGVSLDSDRDAWLTAIQQLSMPWPQMSDLKGWDNAAAQAFNITSIPHTIVVDRQGRILRRGLRGEALEAFVQELLD